MLDRYTYVRSDRRAQEADVPVWDVVREEVRLGGAANVAHNLKAIGGDEVDVVLAGFEHDFELGNMLAAKGIFRATWGKRTMEKHRYVEADSSKYLFRTDNFRKWDDESEAEFMLEHILGMEVGFDCVVMSDYDKGTLTGPLIGVVKRHPLVMVDSKREDLRPFEGCMLLKVNEDEYSRQVSSRIYPNFTKFFQHVVVTRGGKDTQLLTCEQTKSDDRRYVVHTETFPVERVESVDVTGCGDTHTAAMAFSLVKNKDVRMAVKFANACASRAALKFGTSVVERDEDEAGT